MDTQRFVTANSVTCRCHVSTLPLQPCAPEPFGLLGRGCTICLWLQHKVIVRRSQSGYPDGLYLRRGTPTSSPWIEAAKTAIVLNSCAHHHTEALVNPATVQRCANESQFSCPRNQASSKGLLSVESHQGRPSWSGACPNSYGVAWQPVGGLPRRAGEVRAVLLRNGARR